MTYNIIFIAEKTTWEDWICKSKWSRLFTFQTVVKSKVKVNKKNILFHMILFFLAENAPQNGYIGKSKWNRLFTI